jgi:hypothetical protein
VLIEFLRERWKIFAWEPSDMPGIPRELVEHTPLLGKGLYMEIALPPHQQIHAPLANSADAPMCRRAGDEVLLPAHQLERCAGDKSWPWLDRSGPGPEITAGAPGQGQAGGNSLLPAQSWPGAPAIIFGPGPQQILTGSQNTAGAPTPCCAGSNLGSYFCQQPLTSLPLLHSSHTTRAFSQPS